MHDKRIPLHPPPTHVLLGDPAAIERERQAARAAAKQKLQDKLNEVKNG